MFQQQNQRLVVDKISKILDATEITYADKLTEMLDGAKRIFISGAGRSKLVGNFFAMRLMHGGYDVSVVGEIVTPSIRAGDLLVVISGSGETNSVITSARVVKERGGNVVAITSYPSSTLATMADCIVIVKGRTKEDMPASYIERELHPYQRLTPMGTLFEDCCMIFLEGIVASLMEVLEKGEKDMKAKHTILE